MIERWNQSEVPLYVYTCQINHCLQRTKTGFISIVLYNLKLTDETVPITQNSHIYLSLQMSSHYIAPYYCHSVISFIAMVLSLLVPTGLPKLIDAIIHK